MAKELKAQTEIKASVIRDGGFAVKLSHRFVIGVPDLLICLPPFAPILVEVKDLGEVVDRFDRKLDVTPKQADMMRRMSEPYERHFLASAARRTALVFVVFVHRGAQTLAALRRDTERLTWQYDYLHPWTAIQKGRHYPVGPLLEAAGIVRVSGK